MSRQVVGKGSLLKVLTRLIPLVTLGFPDLATSLLEHFEPSTDFDAYDEAEQQAAATGGGGGGGAARHTLMLECLVAMLSSVSRTCHI